MTKYIEGFIVIIFLIIGLFYDGISNTKANASKSIYYDNVSYTNNVIMNGVDGLKIDYNAKLNKPGDYYQIYFDVVNDTKYDFHITNIFLNNDNDNIHYELHYDDGYDVNTGDIIKKGEKRRVSYRVLYKKSFLEEHNFDTNFSIDFDML